MLLPPRLIVVLAPAFLAATLGTGLSRAEEAPAPDQPAPGPPEEEASFDQVDERSEDTESPPDAEAPEEDQTPSRESVEPGTLEEEDSQVASSEQSIDTEEEEDSQVAGSEQSIDTEPEAPEEDMGKAAPRPATPEDSSPMEAKHKMRLTLGADLWNILGQGTFVANSGARNPYVAWALTLRPIFIPTKAVRIFALQELSQELTDTDSGTYNHRVLLSDTLVGGRVTFYTWPLTKTSFDAGLVVRFPTSLTSQYQTLMFGLRPGLGLYQPITKGLSFLFRTEFQKNFHEYTSPVGNAQGNVFFARQGGSELLAASAVSPGGNNVSYEFWNRGLLSYTFLENWTLSALLLVMNGFTYEGYARDDLSGVGAAEGPGQRDAAYAELAAAYTWDGKYILSGGIVSSGTLTPADGSGVRFPFFDFTSPSRNLTSLFVRFSINYPVLGAPERWRTMQNASNEQRRPTRAF